MKKINLLGINVKCHNEREESLINIIKRDIKDFYRTFKNKPYSIGDAYYRLFGKIESLYFMNLINYDNYKLMTDRLFNLYIYSQEKKKKIINNNFPSGGGQPEKGKNMKLLIQVTAFLLILLPWIFLLILL